MEMGKSVGSDQAFYNFSECKKLETLRYSPTLENIKFLPQLTNLTDLDIRLNVLQTYPSDVIPANSLPLVTCLSIASECGKTFVTFANACPNLQVIYAYSVTSAEHELGSYFREMMLKSPNLELLTFMVAGDNVDHDEILFDVGTILPKLKYHLVDCLCQDSIFLFIIFTTFDMMLICNSRSYKTFFFANDDFFRVSLVRLHVCNI